MKYAAYDAGLRQRMKAIAQERRRFRLPTPRCSAQAGGLRDQPQEDIPALSGGEARGAPPWRPQAGHFGTRAPMLVPTAPNNHRSLDFVSDQLTDCRRFRFPTIVDDCTRESLALVPAPRSPASTWRELDRLMLERKPRAASSAPGRLRLSLQFRPKTQDAQAPNPIRVHLQSLGFPTPTLLYQSAPAIPGLNIQRPFRQPPFRHC